MQLRNGATAGLLVVLLAGLAGCGTSGGDGDPPAQTGAGSGEQPGPAAQVAAFRAAKGAVLGTCGTTTDWRVSVLDPATGQVTGALGATDVAAWVAAAGQRLGGEVHPQPCSRGAFSPDRKRLAATAEVAGESRGHVGWLDLDTGAFTDVTGAGTSSGFSTDQVSDDFPTFGPDGQLWFIRDREQVVSAGADGTVTPRPYTRACGFGQLGGLDGGFVVAGDVAVQCAVVHPSGAFSNQPTLPGSQADLTLVLSTPASEDDEPGPGATLPPTPGVTQVDVRADGQPFPCGAIGWVDDDTLLCEGETGARTVDVAPAQVEAGASIGPVEAGPVAVPVSGRRVRSVVADPTGQQVLLVAGLDGGSSTLYRASLTQPGEPQELPTPAALSDSSHFLWWQ